MKVIKAEVDYESESLGNSDLDDTPAPALKKKVKVWIKQSKFVIPLFYNFLILEKTRDI